MALPRTILDPNPGLARDWWFDVLVDGVWTPINGVSQASGTAPITMDSVAPLNSDGSDFPVKSGTAWSLSLTCWRKPTRDAQPGYDPGQEALRDAAEDPWGVATLRWYKVDTVRTEAYQGNGLIQYDHSMGASGDADSVVIAISGQGARLRILHPEQG